ncbi:hypothetical protein E2C01_019330 [Portunus trituberculatus]|uniref:Uncharacterized protein n=1 Tax=Portunus trituberculatus TaxID=210409 RepID=A0A5B7DXY8_PORTR|nr:hypothetical protein [Portunus trituberculatus]
MEWRREVSKRTTDRDSLLESIKRCSVSEIKRVAHEKERWRSMIASITRLAPLEIDTEVGGRRGAVGPRALCEPQGSQAHGFESWPRSEVRKGIHSG